MKIISIRLNDEEEKLFNGQLKNSKLKKSRFLKSRILSNVLTEKQVYMSRAKVQNSYAALLMELERKGIELDKTVLDRFGEDVSNYVSL